MKTTFKYGLVVIKKKKLLVVREYGTEQFLMPGGRPYLGEKVEDSLQREIMEELGTRLNTDSLRFYGSFQDVAANEPNTIVHMDVYLGDVEEEIHPSHEIEEIKWIDSKCDPNILSPIIKNKILPSLVADGLVK